MMRGKYSPTVNSAYAADQEWHVKLRVDDGTYSRFDVDGFDSYGYNEHDIDRAGNHEDDYIKNDGDYNLDEDFNIAYDIACSQWGFDGTRPIIL